MKYLLILVMIAAAVSAARADEFYLTDSKGKKHGPFELKEGGKVSIDGQEYTLSGVLTDERKLIARMKAIVIPEIDFRRAPITDVIEFLQDASVEYVPRGKEKRKIMAILKSIPSRPIPVVALDRTDPTDPFKEVIIEGKEPDVPVITLEARQITLYEAWDVVCKVCGLQWSVQGSGIMIEPKKKAKQASKPRSMTYKERLQKRRAEMKKQRAAP